MACGSRQKRVRASRCLLMGAAALVAASAISIGTVAAAPPTLPPGGPGNNTRGGQQPPMAPTAPIPPVDAAPLNQANTELTKAKTDLRKSQAVLSGAVLRFEKSIDAKPDVKVATQELTVAQSELQNATAKVMNILRSDAAYKVATEKAQTAKADVAQLRTNADAAPDQRYAAAQASLAANDAVSKIESAALSGDPQVVQARATVATKAEAVKKARAQYETALHDDPDWTAASKDVDEKKTKVADAEKALADAKKTYADAQAARQAAIVAQRKAESDRASQGGVYGGGGVFGGGQQNTGPNSSPGR
jgi:hypothetical protein